MTDCDNTLAEENFGDFCKSLGKTYAEAAEDMVKKASKNTGRMFERGAMAFQIFWVLYMMWECFIILAMD